MSFEIKKAVAILKQGGLVAMPTETVYGLAADASNEVAVDKIFQVKERPYKNPLIVHIARSEQLSDWARDISPMAWQLARVFWPGPLTLILKKQAHVSDKVTAGQDTVGLRIPSHAIAQALLHAFGGGLAAPSANKFTHISPTTAAAVKQELGEKVDLILDGGDCTIGLESTIVDLSNELPVVLRPGMIGTDALTAALGMPVKYAQQNKLKVLAPGMHHLHYAPATKTSLIASEKIAEFLKSFSVNDLPIALITHSSHPIPKLKNLIHMQLSQQPKIYAHDLYRVLRELDNQLLDRIIIETVAENSEWDAIRDRLNKASFRD